jgi:hypothetical protein
VGVQTYVPPHPRPLPPGEREKSAIFKLIVWTLETKSLLPLFAERGIPPLWLSFSCRTGGQEGLGEISEEYVFSIMDFLVIETDWLVFFYIPE